MKTVHLMDLIHMYDITKLLYSRVMSTRRLVFFFSSRRRHTRCSRDWSSDVCSSDLCWVSTRGVTTTMLLHHESQARQVLIFCISIVVVPPRVETQHHLPDRSTMQEEIGRASCRERV